MQKFIATIRGKDKLGNDSVFVEKYTDEQIVDHLEKEMNCIKMIADHRGRSSYINGFSEDLGRMLLLEEL
ncbi:MAG: hypothetical protein HWD59_09095 [Coxiellaceae bacterium]|nr:MAG: hypothetical protein HWD59_09095 [Coxiellaceae bacterium]